MPRAFQCHHCDSVVAYETVQDGPDLVCWCVECHRVSVLPLGEEADQFFGAASGAGAEGVGAGDGAGGESAGTWMMMGGGADAGCAIETDGLIQSSPPMMPPMTTAMTAKPIANPISV